MSSEPPARAADPEPQSHEAREIAESFGIDPVRYDRARPRYPLAMVERILAGSPGPQVLDVGIGTGIVARHFRDAGAEVLGVEVDPRMAEFVRAQGFPVEEGKFEDWDAAGRSFDAVVAGQAWHWVDPVAGAARAGEVLRPGGRFAVFWNGDRLPPELAHAFAEIYQRLLPDSVAARRYASNTNGYSGLAARAADGIRAVGVFGAPEEWSYEWDRVYTREEILDQVPTTGGHTNLDRARLDELLEELGAAIDGHGGRFTMAYTTRVLTAARVG